MSEREKLPPWWVRVRYLQDLSEVKGPFGRRCATGDDREGSAFAWSDFDSATGITREKWEAMERAADFVRMCASDMLTQVSPLRRDEAREILAALEGE